MTKRKPDTSVARSVAHREAKQRVDRMNAVIARINVSQRTLAERAKMQQPYVNRVLRGKVKLPSFSTLLRLERAVAFFVKQVDSVEL